MLAPPCVCGSLAEKIFSFECSTTYIYTRYELKYIHTMKLYQMDDLALRNLYDMLPNKDKKSVYTLFENDGRVGQLKRAGCLLYKETFSCVLCQTQIYYDEFVRNTVSGGHNRNRNQLNFHFLYRFNDVRPVLIDGQVEEEWQERIQI